MLSARELTLDRAQGRAVAVQVALVAADEGGRALPERLGQNRVRRQVCLHDAVQQRNEHGPLRMQRLGHLREADSADIGKRVEEPRERAPRDRLHRARQRRIGVDRAQGPLDTAAALENRRDLGRRDARAAAIRQSQVTLVERVRRPRVM